jgi:MerR family mercuric resistance operon transcriptional regulator
VKSSASITIGHLARLVGVKADTIRYYERRKLLPRPARRASGYREYGVDDLARVRFIREAQTLGFTLEEISELLRLKVDPKTTCADVRGKAEAKLAGIEEKITALRRLQTALLQLVNSCRGKGPTGECPILEALETASHVNESKHAR